MEAILKCFSGIVFRKKCSVLTEIDTLMFSEHICQHQLPPMHVPIIGSEDLSQVRLGGL